MPRPARAGGSRGSSGRRARVRPPARSCELLDLSVELTHTPGGDAPEVEQDRAGEARMANGQRLEAFEREPQHLGVAERDDARRARLTVEERELPDDAAWSESTERTDAAPAPTRDRCFQFAVGDDEQRSL